MASDQLIEQYLNRLLSGTRGFEGVAERLLPEAADHIADRTAHYQQAGLDPEAALRSALGDFGDPTTIASDAISALAGGPMRIRIRRIAALVGLVGALALLAAHIVPSANLDGSTLGAATMAAIVLTAMAAITMLVTNRQRTTAVVLSVVAAAVVFVAAWAISGSRLASLPDPWWASNGWYIGFIAAVGVACGTVAWQTGRIVSLAVASLTAGYAGLILNSAWEPVAGIGSGQGNIAVVLTAAGWAVATLTTWRGNTSGPEITALAVPEVCA